MEEIRVIAKKEHRHSEVIGFIIKLEKEFRQILMEDYKNRDPDFVIQINLITDVLRYWRNFRKNK